MSTKSRKALLKRNCSLDCVDAVAYGSLEFCTKFIKKDLVEKKKIVKDKLICIQCLKLKSVHEGSK